MIDDTASIAQSLAPNPAQASLLAVKMAAASQQLIADMLAKQAETVQPASAAMAASNPAHLGQSVDTFA